MEDGGGRRSVFKRGVFLYFVRFHLVGKELPTTIISERREYIARMFAVNCSYVHMLDVVSNIHTSSAEIDEKGIWRKDDGRRLHIRRGAARPVLPQLSPRCVTISRRYILDLALKMLGLTIENTKVTDAGDGELYASISLHLSAGKSRHTSEPTMFHGDYAITREGAVESASSTVLTFLKDKSMVYVDDANYHELKACQHKLLAASSWAMLFEDHSKDLKVKMSMMSKEIDVLSNCQDANNAPPLQLDVQTTTNQQMTPPPTLDGSSKRAGKQSVCDARKDIFGKRKRDCEE